ncbi:Annexin-B12 like protein [Argiope bruennichi]|uniref:Annexin n=1 Tax=Argiope bruennichi TaxID=94029 RepID=A0A8T0FRJ2_ARGBR|nr:Annexin-B12 like protein [Argiope bruennichi]
MMSNVIRVSGGVGQLGVDGELFTKILCSRSISQLQVTFEAYERISGHSLTAAIRSEFSGDTKDTLLAIVYCIKNRNKFFAKQLKDCLKGLGTDDSALVRILVSRSEICEIEKEGSHFRRLKSVILGWIWV